MNNKAHLRPKDFDSNGDIIPTACKEEKGDLISREALRKAFHERIWYFTKSSWDEANALIDNAPTVEVTKPQSYAMGFCDGLNAQTYEKPPMFERPQGEWIKIHDTEYDLDDFKCAICKEEYPHNYNFCPNCGADMRGDNK